MKMGRANVNAIYQKHIRDNPDLSSNPVSRWRQKRAIRKQYAASVRSGEGVAATMENAMRAAKQAAVKSRATGSFLRRHKKGAALALALFKPLSTKFLKPKVSATNADRVIGAQALVTETINNTQAQGQVKVSGQVWSARAAQDVVIPAGRDVKILRIEGVKVIVETV